MKVKNPLFSLLVAPLLVIVSGCHSIITGDGDMATETRFYHANTNVQFSEILVQTDCNVYLHQDSFTKVTASGYANLLPALQTHINGNQLVISVGDDVVLENNNMFLHVTSPSFTQISLQSQASVTAFDSITGPQIEVTNNGSGTISLFGSVNRVVAFSAGSGVTRLCALQADSVNAFMIGSGILSVNTPVLNAAISGSGTIQYLGSPVLNINNTGSGGALQTLTCY